MLSVIWVDWRFQFADCTRLEQKIQFSLRHRRHCYTKCFHKWLIMPMRTMNLNETFISNYDTNFQTDKTLLALTPWLRLPHIFSPKVLNKFHEFWSGKSSYSQFKTPLFILFCSNNFRKIKFQSNWTTNWYALITSDARNLSMKAEPQRPQIISLDKPI